MKKLLFVIMLVTLVSYDDRPITVKDGDKETTVLMMKRVSKDSTVYKMDYDGDALRLFNPETNTAVIKIENNSGNLGTMSIVAIVAFFVGIGLGIVND